MTAPGPDRLLVTEGSLPEALATGSAPGGSVLGYFPLTDRPVWAKRGTRTTTGLPTPSGARAVTVGWTGPTFTRIDTNLGGSQYVDVDASVPYLFSGWARASKAGSKIYMSIQDQTDTECVASGALGGGGKYLINAYTMPTVWTYFETTVLLQPGTTSVRQHTVWWNHYSGQAVDSVQTLADLRLVPLPISHKHPQSEVTGLDTALNGKSATSHTHSEITAATHDTGPPHKGRMVRSDPVHGKLFSYTAVQNVSDGKELVAKNWVDSQINTREPVSWQGTQAQYDALGSYNPNRAYYILDS